MSFKPKVYLASLALVAFVILCAYLLVYHSYGNYGGGLAAVCTLLIFLGLLCLQYLLIDSAWSETTRTAICIVVTVPVIYFLVKAENNFESKSLQSHGAYTSKAISYIYITKGKGGVVYHAVYQYAVDGKTYTHTLGSYRNIYRIGDTVNIVYSTEHPNIDNVVNYKHQR